MQSFTKKLGLWVTPLIMLTVTGTATADNTLCFTPYIGVDAQMRHMGFQKDFGGNILKKKNPQGNFFAGLKFNQYVGVEVGYEFSKTQRIIKDSYPNDIIFGQSIPAFSPDVLSVENLHRTFSKINGWNANLVGFLPVLQEKNDVQLIGSIGVANLKLQTKNTLTTTEVESFIGDPNDTFTIISTKNIFYKKRKAILRIASGIQYKINDCIGLRAMVSWENTSKLKAKAKDAITEKALLGMTAPKNSFQYGLGMFISF